MDYKDYYQLLGVSKSADEKEIKRAYRSLALKYHPDRNAGNKQAEERFKQINEAYEVLGNADNRRKYDRLGSNYHRYQQMGGNPGDFDFSQWFGGGSRGGSQYQTNVNLNDLFGDGRSGGGFSDFFQTIFGNTAASSGTRPNSFGQNLNMEEAVQITLEEAYQGTTRTYSQNGSRFTAKIPAGTTSGTKIRLRGKGYQSASGQGDLFLVVEVLPHKTFDVDGSNLTTDVEVDVVTAVLGGKVIVPTLSGNVQLSIPPGTQGGQGFRLKQKGMPSLRAKESFGDLFARIKIHVPTQLSADEETLYQRLRTLGQPASEASP